jgi:hypothetical protein
LPVFYAVFHSNGRATNMRISPMWYQNAQTIAE